MQGFLIIVKKLSKGRPGMNKGSFSLCSGHKQGIACGPSLCSGHKALYFSLTSKTKPNGGDINVF
jgi:hypothetical protein